MKLVAQQYKREWEEAQILQLIRLYERLFKNLKLFLNLLLYLTYVFLRLGWNIVRIALIPQPYNQLVRDEQWIYRHIK